MTKANQLANKNKDKNIFEPKMKRFINRDKFEKAVANRARELGHIKKLNDLDIILNDVKILKEINLKKKDDFIKLGSFINENSNSIPLKSGDWKRRSYHSKIGQQYYENVINYYWDNAYKVMKPQPEPTDGELEKVAYELWYLTPKFHKVKGYIGETEHRFPTEGLSSKINHLTPEQHKIIMKIAYNDGMNKNKKFLYKACRIHQKSLDDAEKERIELKVKREKEWNERTPEQIEKHKQFVKKITKSENDFFDLVSDYERKERQKKIEREKKAKEKSTNIILK